MQQKCGGYVTSFCGTSSAKEEELKGDQLKPGGLSDFTIQENIGSSFSKYAIDTGLTSWLHVL